MIERLVAGAALFAGAASPAPAHDFTLESGVWEILVVPGDASGLTFGELFGDDLPIDELFDGGADPTATWAAYRFDGASGSYSTLGAGDSLAVGEGFWIQQLTGAAVVLDVPVDLPPVPVSGGPCAVDACYGLDLPSVAPGAGVPDAFAVAYGMGGLPAAQFHAMSEIVFSRDASGGCASGCSLVQAATRSRRYTPPGVYAYDSVAGAYADLPGSAVYLAPWQGFFWAVSSEVGATSTLHLPLFRETFVVGTLESAAGAPIGMAEIYLGDDAEPIEYAFAGEFFLALPADADVSLRFEADGFAPRVVSLATGPIDTETDLSVTLVP